jgi:hypothetical protein
MQPVAWRESTGRSSGWWRDDRLEGVALLRKQSDLRRGSPGWLPLSTFVIDWDGDGAFDLLSGSSNGAVQYAESRAGKGEAAELSPFRPGNLFTPERIDGSLQHCRHGQADDHDNARDRYGDFQVLPFTRRQAAPFLGDRRRELTR